MFDCLYRKLNEGGCAWKIFSQLYLRFQRRKYPVFSYIKDNVKFKDRHKGETCFVLGNGPSLKEVDLKRISKYVVFSANFAPRINGYECLENIYHFMIDGAMFGVNNKVRIPSEELKPIYDFFCGRENTSLFLGYDAYDALEEKLLHTEHSYLFTRPTIRCKKIKGFDISCALSWRYNVVLVMIATAIYMGFSEIYLLGCDFTLIQTLIDAKLNEESNSIQHAYSSDKHYASDDVQRLVYQREKMSNRLLRFVNVLEEYKAINDYCAKKGIMIKNLTSRTLIDEIERDELDNVLSIKESQIRRS